MKRQIFTLLKPRTHGRQKKGDLITIGLECHRGQPCDPAPPSVFVLLYLNRDTLVDLAKMLTETQGLRLRDALDEAEWFKSELVKSFKSGATHPGDHNS